MRNIKQIHKIMSNKPILHLIVSTLISKVFCLGVFGRWHHWNNSFEFSGCHCWHKPNGDLWYPYTAWRCRSGGRFEGGGAACDTLVPLSPPVLITCGKPEISPNSPSLYFSFCLGDLWKQYIRRTFLPKIILFIHSWAIKDNCTNVYVSKITVVTQFF